MLNLIELMNEIERRRDELRRESIEASEECKRYREKLDEIEYWEGEDVPDYIGAIPIEDGKVIKRFEIEWEKREDALEWMDRVLSGVKVGAVDGSQIYPTQNLRYGLVQTGFVINYHDGNIDSQTHVHLITPNDFEAHRVYAYSKELTDAMRFEKECGEVETLLSKDITTFFDGSLVVSHANSLNESIRNIYINSILKLLDSSEEQNGIFCGYIDTPHARDVVSLMSNTMGLSSTRLTDAFLFGLMEWGDRSKVFLCDRDDRRYGVSTSRSLSTLDRYGKWKRGIAFFYISLNRHLPSRVEFPVWIHERGLTDTLADIVRAESLIRGDYPDILMRAHREVLIKTREHKLFEDLLRRVIEEGVGAKEFYKRYDV
jgi:hypothetical protein